MIELARDDARIPVKQWDEFIPHTPVAKSCPATDEVAEALSGFWEGPLLVLLPVAKWAEQL